MEKERDITCKRCHNIFRHKSKNKVYCAECLTLQKKEQWMKWRAITNNNKRKRDPDSDLQVAAIHDSDPNLNSIKKEIISTDTIAFQEECKIMDGDKAELILFDVSSEIKKSESLSDWHTLVHTYGDYEGDVFEYKPYETNEDGKKWMKTGSNRKMKLKEWNKWFQIEQKKPIEERECLYITGIALLSSDINILRRNRVISAFGCCGQLDLTSYILEVCRDAPIPRLDFILLISPPWGQIMTYPHVDGFGSQLSTHCYLMGHGENLIHLWPRFDPYQDHYFRKILSLPAITDDQQQQPHDLEYEVDSNIDVWDEKLEGQLNDYGIYSKSIKIKPGQAVILPQGKYHCFKKINHEPNQSSEIIPMVSCACDASYIGVDNFIDNYYTIMRCHQLHKIKYSLYELGLLCLFKLCQSAPLDSNTIIFYHAKGALTIFKKWIKEQKLLLNQLGGSDTQIVSDVNKMEKELECDECKSPISNFFIVPSKKKYTCLMCGKQRQKGHHHRGPIEVHYRLFDIATAERIVDKVSKKVNSDNNTVVDVTLISNQPKPDDIGIIGSGHSSDSNNNNDKPAKKRKLNSNTSTQIVTNNNNIHNGIFQRHDLDKEIDRFIPLVKDILEGRTITERAELWNQSTAQERRMFRYKNGYGGFDDEELDYIFNALVLRLLLESSSTIASQPHLLVAYILDVVWPDLGVELLMHRRLGITKEEAKEILENDSRYEWSRIESIFQ